jgi:glutamine synthetase
MNVPNATLPEGVRYVAVQWVDIHGAAKAKIVPAAAWEQTCSVDGGAGFAGFANHGFARRAEHPELIARPDPTTVTVLPHRPEFAVAFSTVTDNGQTVGCDARAILRRVQTQAAAAGLSPMAGIEPEFFLLRETPDGRLVPFDDLDVLDKPCYDLKALLRNAPIVTAIVDAMQDLDWAVTALDHEDGNGQFEINFGFADAVTTADRFTLLRTIVADLAAAHGAIATFMPKPLAGRTGSGSHVHVSCWAPDGTNAFADPADPRGLGLSRIGYAFAAGVMAHARGLAALTMPTVNSYKRLWSGGGSSGATWSPAAIVLGANNRTAMLRVPGAGRFENRAVDGSCNPYLALAGMIAAGLDGVVRGIDSGDPIKGAAQFDGGPTLPRTLVEALDALESDDVLRAALGDEAFTEFVAVKRLEWAQYMDAVSDWERETYLRRT